MSRQVKGVVFVDYVRMLRSHKDLPWWSRLKSEDLPFLEQRIEPGQWYPMATFERLGVAILQTVAGGDLQLVRAWGRLQTAHVVSTLESMVVPGDPRESLMRFYVYRRSFFDFETLTMLHIDDRSADLQVGYGMSVLAEEAAAIQTMGFFEGLVELADGRSVEASFTERTWLGDPRTVLRLTWELPAAE